MAQDFNPGAPVILQTEDKARGEFAFTQTAGQVLASYWGDEGPHRSLYYSDDAAEEIITRADAITALSGPFESLTFYDEEGDRYRVTPDYARSSGESMTGGPFYVISGPSADKPNCAAGPFATYGEADTVQAEAERKAGWAMITEQALTP
jgi:hypothetical protein